MFICAECNIGIESEKQIDEHMRTCHMDVALEEKINRLESELRLEKEQHMDHKHMLKDSLNEVTSLKQYIDQIKAMKHNLEGQIEDLKKELEDNDVKHENNLLKKNIADKEKEIKKNTEKHSEEMKKMKKQQMLNSENLRSAVLERETLRENDRILLNTFDMMKKYMEQLKECYNKNNSLNVNNMSFKCEKCDFASENLVALNQHMANDHKNQEGKKNNTIFACEECEFVSKKKDSFDDHLSTEHQDDGGLSYCCTKCRYETNSEKKLTEHIKKKHDSTIICKECREIFETKAQHRVHVEKEHTVIDCQICNFKAKNIDELSQHVGSLHNKMFQCKNCRFEATNEMMLREHTRKVHQRKNRQKSFTCD